jgi:hypothetical protein
MLNQPAAVRLSGLSLELTHKRSKPSLLVYYSPTIVVSETEVEFSRSA